MAVEGAIADRAKAIIPLTWDAFEKDRRYGESLLRASIDIVKERVFGTVVAPEAESIYPLIVVDYVAKLCVIDLLTPAIDFWLQHPIHVQTKDPSEIESFENRAENLRRLREDLIRETKNLEDIVEPLIGFRRPTNGPRPAINTLNDEFLTPSPQEWGRPWRATDRS